MTEAPRSTVRLRKIGRELRRLREESGYTLVTAGRHLERSASSLSKIETGMQWLRLRDLGYILDEYKAPADLRAQLMVLADQDRRPGWWDSYKDLVSPEAIDRASLEHSATGIITTETTFVPGLLQTESYARAIIQGLTPKHPPAKLEHYVAFRLARQGILDSDTLGGLDVVIDEAALRRLRGGRDVMRSQLRSLLIQSDRHNVKLQVLPLDVDAGPAYAGQFQLLDIGLRALSVAMADHPTGQWIVEDDNEIAQYRENFEQVRSTALSEPASRDRLHHILSNL